MFRQLDFRSFFNFLGRNKLYTAINIFGLSLSLMFVILIADYTVRQLTVDSFHSKASSIYVVSNENTVASAYFLQKHLLDRYPEIEATCAVSFEDHHTVEADGKLALADVLYADTTFFRISTSNWPPATGGRRSPHATTSSSPNRSRAGCSATPTSRGAVRRRPVRRGRTLPTVPTDAVGTWSGGRNYVRYGYRVPYRTRPRGPGYLPAFRYPVRVRTVNLLNGTENGKENQTKNQTVKRND